MNEKEKEYNCKRISDAGLYYLSKKLIDTEESEEVVSGTAVPLNPAEQEKAKKKRKWFGVFAQFLFKDSEHDNLGDLFRTKLAVVWKALLERVDDFSNPDFSLSEKIRLGILFFPEQILYMGSSIVIGLVRCVDFLRRYSHGMWVMECAKNAGYEEELNEIIENYCLGNGPLNPFNENQGLTSEQADGLNPIMEKMKTLRLKRGTK